MLRVVVALLVALLGLAGVVGFSTLMSVPAAAGVPGAAYRTSPELPGGTVEKNILRPLVYPGGGVYGFGNATASDPAMPASLNSPIVAMASATPTPPTGTGTGTGTGAGSAAAGASAQLSGGYWLVGADGGVYALGGAPFEGSLGNLRLNAPVVGIAATPDAKGYWLVGLDGGVFSFGDAKFYGSMGGKALAASIVGIAATPDGLGYWLVGADGGVFTFGDAHFYGSMGGQPLNAPVVGIARTLNGLGYWLVGADGGVFTFGDAAFLGSLATSNAATPISALVPTPNDAGYWMLDPDGWNYSFANPPANGSFPGSAQIVAAAESQVQPDPETGYFCNPYGPCEEWCALFASWAWQQGGVAIPTYAFTGDIYDWAAANGTVTPGDVPPVPGDAVLYGTGPSSTATSLHTGIVAQVWPDGAIVTIEGDAGPGQAGSLAVVVNGPFLIGDSLDYNGMGIYAFAQP